MYLSVAFYLIFYDLFNYEQCNSCRSGFPESRLFFFCEFETIMILRLLFIHRIQDEFHRRY